MPAARLLDAAADLALDLRRGQRKALVGAARRHAEAAAACGRRGRAGSRRSSASRSSGVRPAYEKLAMPNVRRMRSPTSSRRRVRPEHDLDAAHQRAHRCHVEVGDRARAGCGRAGRGTRPVLPLERDLLVVDDDRSSLRIDALESCAALPTAARMAADDGALDRSGQAGVDPVAGEKQAGHAGSRRRARRLAGRHRERRALLADDDRAAHRRPRARRAARRAPRARPASISSSLVRADDRLGAARHERQVRRLLAEERPLVEHPLHRPAGQPDERLGR